jgi:hypothetical protein
MCISAIDKKKTITFAALAMSSLLITAVVLTTTLIPMQAFAASGGSSQPGVDGGHGGNGREGDIEGMVVVVHQVPLAVKGPHNFIG